MNQPTIYEVRRKNRKAGGHFFDESTLRFFGDTISDYAVKDGFVVRKKDGKRWRIMPNYRLHPAE